MDNYENGYDLSTKKIKHGIGGWLLFFVVTMFIKMFFTFILIMSSTITYLSSFINLELYGKISLLFSLLLLVLSFVLTILVFVQIIRKNFAGKYAALILCFLGIFVEILNLVLLKRATTFFVLAGTVIWNTIWILYFNRSKRVENTLINESEGQWVKSVANIGGILLTIGYIGGIAFHLYTAYLFFTIYKLAGLFISIMLPGISEIYMFISSISSSGTFYNPYSVLTLFYIVTTFGTSIILSYISNKMEKDGFDI